MTREEFIAGHVAVCKAAAAKKYDPKKSNAGKHSLAYSQRKCAKRLWRQRLKKGAA